jgi:hypothetical protein
MSVTCIKAFHRQEERYCGLSLEYPKGENHKETIVNTVEKLKKKYGVSPDLFYNDTEEEKKTAGIYIEFADDYDRESQEFFEELVKTLGIKECQI